MIQDKELEEIRRKKMENMIHTSLKETKIQGDGKIIEITDLNFEEKVKSGRLIVIDCWAAWCAPCRMLSPLIDDLAKEYAGKIVFGKFNVDENRKIPLKYQIMSIPTILVFKNGDLVDRLVGVMPKQNLKSRLSQHL